MILKTNAIVLRVLPFSRTSHIVTWLTEDYGKISTMIKGACRPKSQFLGQYDLYYTCEMLFYSHERNGLHIAKECTPLETRTAFRSNWRAASCASYISELLTKLIPPGHTQPELYKLTETVFDFLTGNEIKPQILFWFEIRLLSISGFEPRLFACAKCGAPLPEPAGLSFSTAHGGIMCANCSAQTTTTRIPPDTLAILKTWQNAQSLRSVCNTKCTINQLLDFRRILGRFLECHLDIMPQSRNIALEMLTQAPAKLIVGREEAS